MENELLRAIKQIAAERELPQMTVTAAIESALAVAYKRESEGSEVEVSIDPESGEVKVVMYRVVVDDEELTDGNVEVKLSEARLKEPKIEVGDHLYLGQLEYHHGRIAAQATKQMILQHLQEAKRNLAFEQFKDREGQMLSGSIYRFNQRNALVDIGRTIAVMPASEQSPSERLRVGQKLKVYVASVEQTVKGPEIIVSRTHPELLRRLFELEVPEIANGTVQIRSMSREAGSRSKIAVYSESPDIDAVGTCVGLRGIRIQNIVNELVGEKVDVVQWDPEISKFIMNSLNPASVEKVELDDENHAARVMVAPKSLSLAIGKEGQNARLAAKLTNWALDIVSYAEATTPPAPETKPDTAAQESDTTVKDKKASAAKKEATPAEEEKPTPAKKKPELDVRALEDELAKLKEEEAIAEVPEEEEQPPVETLSMSEEDLFDSDMGLGGDSDSNGTLRFAEDIGEVQSTRTRSSTTSSGKGKNKRAKNTKKKS